jgi:4-aminobutyrate aminotransferase-like enzyme
MALASLAEHEKAEVRKLVATRGERLKQALEAVRSPFIWHRRGRGLMQGMELIAADGAPYTDLAIAIVKKALQDGILLLADSPDSNVLSFTPPFSISDDEIDFVAAKIQEYLTFLPGSIS